MNGSAAVASAFMADYPDNLTDSQRLLRVVEDMAHDMKSARWYLGLLCFVAVIGLVVLLLWAFGVFTVEVKLGR